MRRRTISGNDTEAVFTLSSSSQTYQYYSSGTYRLDVLRLDGLSPGSSILSEFSMTSSGSIPGSLISYNNKVVLQVTLQDRTTVYGSITGTYTITYGSQSQVFTVTHNGDTVSDSNPYWKNLSINLGTFPTPTLRKGSDSVVFLYYLSASMSGTVTTRYRWNSGNYTLDSYEQSFNGAVLNNNHHMQVQLYMSGSNITKIYWRVFYHGANYTLSGMTVYNAVVGNVNTRIGEINSSYVDFDLTDLGNSRYRIVTKKKDTIFYEDSYGSSKGCGSLKNLVCGNETTRNNCLNPQLTLVIDLSDTSNPVVESTSVTWLPYS